MSLRGAERRSNLDVDRLEIASGFALAMTIFQSFRIIKTNTTFGNLYNLDHSMHDFHSRPD